MKVKEAERKLYSLTRLPPPPGLPHLQRRLLLLFCFTLATLLGMQDLRCSPAEIKPVFLKWKYRILTTVMQEKEGSLGGVVVICSITATA